MCHDLAGIAVLSSLGEEGEARLGEKSSGEGKDRVKMDRGSVSPGNPQIAGSRSVGSDDFR
jgi:hypothetical protein